MRRYSYLAFLLFISLPYVVFGQENIRIGVEQVNISQKDNGYCCYQWNKPRNWGSMHAIDTSLLTVAYDYSFPVKEEEGFHTLMDLDILQIGSSVNRFYSAYSQRVDSIAFNYLMSMGQKNLDLLQPDWTPSRLRRTLYDWIPEGVYPLYLDVYTNHSTGIRTVSSRFQYDEYQYTENTEPFEWTMVAGTDTIMGYPCNKAEATFRGRKWIAYYTLDISYSYGPWKFSGLPGLILKVTDEKELFRWEAVGITKPKDEPICEFMAGYSTDKRIYVWIPDHKVRKCSRKEMERLWKRFWNAPLSIQILDKMEATFVDGKKEVKVSISDPVPDDFYPKLELDL
jgi:GLPGLI family protein